MEVMIKDLLPGVNYVLQARSKSANGVNSQWSNSFKLATITDTTAPAPITGLTWAVNHNAFAGAWTKPTLDANGAALKDFNGYEITVTADAVSKKFISMQERFDFSFEQNVAAFGSPKPSVGISIKVRDIVGNLSTAVTASASNPVPANVTGFAGVGFPLAIQLTWDQSTEDDFKAFELHHSTVSSGFTPGPGTLLTTTGATSFLFPTTSFINHYFKLRQVDVFDQGSAAYVAVTAQPLNTTGIDTTAPNPPSSVVVTSTADAGGVSHIDVSWTASGSSNLASYLVRYSTDQVTWRYVTVPNNQVIAQIKNLEPNTAYYVGVAAVSFVSSYSAWVNAGTYPITTAQDTTAPSTPTAPSVAFDTLTVQVTHALTKAAGGNLEADVRYLEVHGSVTTGFTASSSTLIGTIDVAAQGVTVVANFPVPVTDSVSNMFWRVKAVDFTGNKSTQSAQSTGLPGLIQGVNIATATITDAKIGSLSAAKLVAGTAFINNLSVQSQLTLDAASGYIASTNFSVPSKTGWRLDQNGLVIYDGSIAAKSLLLQNGNNIAISPFADFEFNSDYYHDTSNVANTATMTATSTMLLNMLYTGMKFGKQALRVWNTSITGATVHKLHFATNGDSATGVNIDLSPGDYIFSIWAKKNGAVNQTLKLGLYPDTGSAIVSSGITISSTSWTQYSAVLTVPSGVSKVKQYISLEAVTTGYDIVIDGLQLEPKLTAETAASTWKPPSTTVIDGGAIITGSIRSSAASATVPGQPAWSINTAGNMQVGDALIRGKLIMGVADDARNLIPKAYTSWESIASFYYDGSNLPNLTNMQRSGTNFSLLRLQQDSTGSPPAGTYGMRTYIASGATPLSSTWAYAGANPNFNLVPGSQYIISFYVKNNDVTKTTTAEVGLWNNAVGNTYIITGQAITTSYVRYSSVFTAPADGFCQFFFGGQTGAAETSFDLTWDGFQIEAAPVGSTTPSSFIDGTVGISSMASANYLMGSKGWSINSDGTAEFNNTTIRGALQVDGASGTIKTDITSTYPTIYFNPSSGTNYGFINSAGGGTTRSYIGTNSSQFTAASGGHTLRPRVYITSKVRMEIVDNTIGTNSFQGGSLVLDEALGTFSAFNNANVSQANIIVNNSGSITNQIYNSSSQILGQIAMTSSSIDLSHFAAGSFKTGVTIDDTKVRLSTTGGFSVDLLLSNGYLKRTPDGDWFTLTPPSTGANNGYAIVAGWDSPQIKINSDGTVVLRGAIATKGTYSPTNEELLWTVPAQYRPANQIITTVTAEKANSAPATNGPPRIFIRGDGNCYLYGIGGNTTNRIYFDTAKYSLV